MMTENLKRCIAGVHDNLISRKKEQLSSQTHWKSSFLRRLLPVGYYRTNDQVRLHRPIGMVLLLASLFLLAITGAVGAQTTLLMVDFGDTDHDVQAGWIGVSRNGGTDNSIQDISTLDPNPNTVATSQGSITHSIATPWNQLDYRDRKLSYNDGLGADYTDPDFGDMSTVIQDEIKVDAGNAAAGTQKDGYLDVVLTGMDAGVYEVTTFHQGWIGLQYDWSEFNLLLEIGAGNGFAPVPEAQNLSVTSAEEPFGGPTRVETQFESPGPSAQVSLRIATIPDTSDGTGGPGSMVGQDEVPLNGFVLEFVGSGDTSRPEWLNSGVEDWNESGNWTLGGPAGTNDQTAVFGDNIAGPTLIGVNSPVTVNGVELKNSLNSYVIGGHSSVNLKTSSSSQDPSITVEGTHEFQARVNLMNNTTVDVSDGSTLIFNNALDLMGNTLTKTGDGQVAIRNDLITSGGTIDVQGGTVSGNGTISGNVNNGAGVLSPGNISGALEVGSQSTIPEPASSQLVMLTVIWLVAVCRRLGKMSIRTVAGN